MAFFRIINLSVDGDNLPIINGAMFVVRQTDELYSAFLPAIQNGQLQYHPTLADIYLDESGSWLVSASSESTLDTIGAGETLENVVNSNPANWHSYKSKTQDGTFVFPDIAINKGILTALEQGVSFDHGPFSVSGIKPSITSSLGAGPMQASDLESQVSYHGEEPLNLLDNKNIKL